MAEPIALLDVNVLIALIDPQHVQNETSHRWFQAHGCGGWASCPLIQNALLRILGNPRYPNSSGGPAVVMHLLQGLLGHPAHVFWPADLSWDAAGVFVVDGPLHHGQITDTYLLGLAVHHLGKLVSFDRLLSPGAVCGGAEALQLLDPG